MADIKSKEDRSRNMAAIKGKDTKPEMIVRKYLFSKGLRYRLHDKKLPGNPDIVLSKFKTVIFVNGCFWHGHDECKYFRLPKSNVEFWKRKIERNIERDREAMKKFGLERGLIGSDAFHKRKQDYNRQLTKQLQADVERINSELTVKQQELKETSEKVKDLQEKTSGVKNKLLSVVGKGEIPGLKKRIEELEKEVKDLKHEREQLKKKIEDLTADSLRQRNAYQTEIAKLQKERKRETPRYNPRTGTGKSETSSSCLS